MGLTAKYKPADIATFITQSVFREMEDHIISSLKQAGQNFVDSAKFMTSEQGSFTDRTGDLRSSIGYYIYASQKQVDSYFSGNAAGKEAADNAVSKITKHRKCYQLIGIAGMSYA